MDPIRTERLVVRRFAPTDLADFLDYQADPVVRRHLTGEPHTDEAAAGYLAAQSLRDDDARDAWHDWAVEHVADGRVIGNVGVWLPTSPAPEGDVGFQFHPAYHGHGYASEAVKALVRHLFDAGLRLVTASCATDNEASARLLLGLGMTEVASLSPNDRTFVLRCPISPRS